MSKIDIRELQRVMLRTTKKGAAECFANTAPDRVAMLDVVLAYGWLIAAADHIEARCGSRYAYNLIQPIADRLCDGVIKQEAKR